MAEKQRVTASEVRTWARSKGYQVGDRGHLPKEVVEAFNKAHRVKEFVNPNPWLGANRSTSEAVPA